jgi:16S rRNA (adenine1518-N6/adenine1519-N6)-dimethyltransferase
VEKDERLIPILSEKFREEIAAGKLRLVQQDIFSFEPQRWALRATGYKIVANIPYYITGEILRRCLSEWPQPAMAILLLQKEVAERITARDGKESLLSVSVKSYGRPELVSVVKAGSFSPVPKVDSAIVKIDNISKGFFGEIPEKSFFTAVKAGFAHKRKKLLTNLGKLFPKEKVSETFQEKGVRSDIRAENLNIGEWKEIIKTLQSK